MAQWLRKISKIGSYLFIAGVSFFIYNILNLHVDSEYSLTQGTLLSPSIAHADGPLGDAGDGVGFNYLSGDGGNSGTGAGCGPGPGGDSDTDGS